MRLFEQVTTDLSPVLAGIPYLCSGRPSRKSPRYVIPHVLKACGAGKVTRLVRRWRGPRRPVGSKTRMRQELLRTLLWPDRSPAWSAFLRPADVDQALREGEPSELLWSAATLELFVRNVLEPSRARTPTSPR